MQRMKETEERMEETQDKNERSACCEDREFISHHIQCGFLVAAIPAGVSTVGSLFFLALAYWAPDEHAQTYYRNVGFLLSGVAFSTLVTAGTLFFCGTKKESELKATADEERGALVINESMRRLQ